MPWWAWVLVGVGAVLAALAVMALVGLSLWRRARLLLRDLGVASERMAALQQAAEALERTGAEPAVFADPALLRRQVARARKQREADRRRRMRERAREFG